MAFYAFWACMALTALKEKADRKSTRLNSSHLVISYAVFCLKKKAECSLRHPCRHSPAPPATLSLRPASLSSEIGHGPRSEVQPPARRSRPSPPPKVVDRGNY